ncbi:endonuclease [Aliarcobacter butzleri]|uniref:endonuclease n=1 Tax=Aliarcobacter butzleri TaxID=28197 RepID=UPI00263CF605|nr:endonuclease [Aliarcobacter butzleri]MDN5042294.1 endonuclease [Aliarcobacter butzleri]
MKKILLLITLFFTTIFAESFSESKKLLKEIYKGHQTTFYCGCKYDPSNKDNMIDRNSCGYVPRNELTKKGKENERANRIEWEHIMPAENFGRHLACWKDGGRKACSKDPIFNKMEADMHNLVPAIGELNADRSNFRYGADKPKVGMYGECKFEVDFDANRAYVRDEIKGDIARAYLYMSKTYNINLSDQERKLMEAWDKQDPIDEWEIEKNKRIENIK